MDSPQGSFLLCVSPYKCTVQDRYTAILHSCIDKDFPVSIHCHYRAVPYRFHHNVTVDILHFPRPNPRSDEQASTMTRPPLRCEAIQTGSKASRTCLGEQCSGGQRT